jgi:hypothetical protein
MYILTDLEDSLHNLPYAIFSSKTVHGIISYTKTYRTHTIYIYVFINAFYLRKVQKIKLHHATGRL